MNWKKPRSEPAKFLTSKLTNIFISNDALVTFVSIVTLEESLLKDSLGDSEQSILIAHLTMFKIML